MTEIASFTVGSRVLVSLDEDGLTVASKMTLAEAKTVIEFLASGWIESYSAGAEHYKKLCEIEEEEGRAPNPILPQEINAQVALEAAGFSISRPGDGTEGNSLKHQWGVFLGSHGGHGRRLVSAMERALRCCGIGEFWKAENGELARTVFSRIAKDHLGIEMIWPKEWSVTS